jgi:hypothetical protein
VVEELRRRNRGWGDQLDSFRRLRTVADYDLVPNDPTRRQWQKNWTDAKAFALRLLPIVQAL